MLFLICSNQVFRQTENSYKHHWSRHEVQNIIFLEIPVTKYRLSVQDYNYNRSQKIVHDIHWGAYRFKYGQLPQDVTKRHIFNPFSDILMFSHSILLTIYVPHMKHATVCISLCYRKRWRPQTCKWRPKSHRARRYCWGHTYRQRGFPRYIRNRSKCREPIY